MSRDLSKEQDQQPGADSQRLELCQVCCVYLTHSFGNGDRPDRAMHSFFCEGQAAEARSATATEQGILETASTAQQVQREPSAADVLPGKPPPDSVT